MSLAFVFSSTRKKLLKSFDSQEKKVKVSAMIESKAFKVFQLLNFDGTYKPNSTEPL